MNRKEWYKYWAFVRKTPSWLFRKRAFLAVFDEAQRKNLSLTLSIFFKRDNEELTKRQTKIQTKIQNKKWGFNDFDAPF